MPKLHALHHSWMSSPCRGLLALGAIFVLGCSEPHSLPADGATEDATIDDAAACPFCFDAGAFEAAAQVPPDALPPPAIACDEDAGEAGAECPLPPSICVDPQWMEYFDNGRCEDAGCAYDALLHDCVYGCVDGGCSPGNFTAPRPY